MNEIMSGQTTPTQNAAFLAALSTKSARAETTDEIAGCAAAMRAHATKVETGMELFEIVGTGGDNAHSFNISTTSALVAAAGGVKVAKHGNRAASSQCGTADCLEALGVNIQQSPEKCVELLREVGMCFFFAQKYHTSMKYVGAIRKELGFRTVFNILGPLTNPGTPSMQLLGVYDDYLVQPLAQVLISLGVRRGMVVYGQDKLDEISLSAPTTVCEIKDGWFKSRVITPEEFGFARCAREDLKGGTPAENAAITRAILNGAQGHKRNAVLLNAGAALYIAGKADTMADSVALARELIDSGAAAHCSEQPGGGDGMTILEQLADHARARVAAAKEKAGLDTLQAQCRSLERTLGRGQGRERFQKALSKPGLSFLCELKKASPSKGLIDPEFPYLDIAKDYEAAGADAVSCLTEPKWFLGSDDIFRRVRQTVSLPMLRKDFTVDPYQIYEARLIGADCVLLICALLDTQTLNEYLKLCQELGLAALVETHDEDEVRSALAAGATILGVNNRNLKDFSVDFQNAKRLRDLIPPEVLYVAESGISGPQDVAELKAVGADAVLIGETLMRAPNKRSMLEQLREAAR